VPGKPEDAGQPELDVPAVLSALQRHGVEYLLVGGLAAQVYGATRPTQDFDCLVRRGRDNLDRLSEAMRDLGARLRVDGLSDDEARALPVQVDGVTLASSELSTWRTDAGDFDVLTSLPGRDGRRLGYEDIEPRADQVHGFGFTIRAASLGDIIASKEWTNRPKDRSALPELYRLLAGEP
jgi:hypothetical protein